MMKQIETMKARWRGAGFGGLWLRNSGATDEEYGDEPSKLDAGYPLIEDYALNHTRGPSIVWSIFPKGYRAFSEGVPFDLRRFW